jgi:hypothetical protein
MAPVIPDVSKELIASTIRVTKIGEIVTSAVIDNE